MKYSGTDNNGDDRILDFIDRGDWPQGPNRLILMIRVQKPRF